MAKYVPFHSEVETGLSKMNRWIQNLNDDYAPSRNIDKMYALFNQSTAIVGVDALYLNATERYSDECTPYNLRNTLSKFTHLTYITGKVLILGNVPKEDFNSFDKAAQIFIGRQNEDCRVEINEVLAETCKPEQNCYVVDLEGIVPKLNTDGFLKFNDGSIVMRQYRGMKSVRPDGANLSNGGTQILVEAILNSFKASPPKPAPGMSVPNTPL